MLIKTSAIVLRNTNYSESSVISRMYTRERGIRSYMINGVRKSKAKISSSMIQPLSILELDAYDKAGTGIQRIKELKCRPLLVNIGQDFRKRSVAMFMVEILNACLHEEDSDITTYDDIHDLIINLEYGNEVSNYPVIFMVKLAQILGIDPHGHCSESYPYLDIESGVFVNQRNENTVNFEISRAISKLRETEINQHLVLDPTTRKLVLETMIDYFKMHIMKKDKINSMEVLSEVMHAWHKV